MDRDPFLQAIEANPEDNALRLVYADWLEEHGETQRAEYIRLEFEWAKVPARKDLWCMWGAEAPPPEETYPPSLRLLSEKAAEIDLGWLASVSRIRIEIAELVDRLVARIPATRTSTSRPLPDMISARWRAAMDDLRGMFERHLGEHFAPSRFVVPVDYALFTSLIDGELTCDEWQGMSYFDALFDASLMVERTTYNCEMNAEYREELQADRAQLLAQCGLWIFAGYRDKHDFHLCCDLGNPLFGVLVDQHDSHPWIMPRRHGPCPSEVMTRSFLDYLRSQAAKAEQGEPVSGAGNP